MKRIGIFGCMADPLTLAHREIVRKVLEDNVVDEVLVVPTAVTWHRAGKTSWLSDFERLQVAKKLIYGIDNASVLDSEIQLKIAASKSKIATERLANRHFAETLLEIVSKRNGFESEFYPIFGQDSYDTMKTWDGWQQIVELSNGIIVVKRAGYGAFTEQADIPVAYVLELPTKFLSQLSATKVRETWSKLGLEAYIAHLEKIISAEASTSGCSDFSCPLAAEEAARVQAAYATARPSGCLE